MCYCQLYTSPLPSYILSAKRTQYAERLLTLQYLDNASDSTPFIFSKNRLMTRSLIIELREVAVLVFFNSGIAMLWQTSAIHHSVPQCFPLCVLIFKQTFFFPIISHINSICLTAWRQANLRLKSCILRNNTDNGIKKYQDFS